MTRTMTRTAVSALALTLAACAGAPETAPSPTAAPTVAPTLGPSVAPTVAPSPDHVDFVVLPPGDRIELSATCRFEGPDGDLILRGDLPGGGAIQLRRGDDGGDIEVSLLPSADADPVATRDAADTTWSEEDGVITGTTTLWLAEGADERMEVEFAIRWDESVPECAS